MLINQEWYSVVFTWEHFMISVDYTLKMFTTFPKGHTGLMMCLCSVGYTFKMFLQHFPMVTGLMMCLYRVYVTLLKCLLHFPVVTGLMMCLYRVQVTLLKCLLHFPRVNGLMCLYSVGYTFKMFITFPKGQWVNDVSVPWIHHLGRQCHKSRNIMSNTLKQLRHIEKPLFLRLILASRPLYFTRQVLQPCFNIKTILSGMLFPL